MNNKPKTFEEWLRANKIILHRTHKLNKVDGAWVCEMKDAWNARAELAREEIEATRQEMQAEIDKRDDLLWFIRDHLKWRTYTNGTSELILSEEKYEWLESRMRELNQGSKDGQ